MSDDAFDDVDVSRALLKGLMVAKQTHGARGTRFVFRGPAVDARRMEVVCRIAGGGVRVVTVYRV
jgi:hypothetical protein